MDRKEYFDSSAEITSLLQFFRKGMRKMKPVINTGFKFWIQKINTLPISTLMLKLIIFWSIELISWLWENLEKETELSLFWLRKIIPLRFKHSLRNHFLMRHGDSLRIKIVKKASSRKYLVCMEIFCIQRMTLQMQ